MGNFVELPDIQKHAEEMFAKAFPWIGAWPTGWRVEWKDEIPDAFGQTCWDDKLIQLCLTAARQYSLKHLNDTVCHELTHLVVGPSVPHGRGFSQRVRWAKKRAGLL